MKVHVKRRERQATDDKYLTNDYYPECTKNSQNPIVKEQTIRKWEYKMKNYFTKEDIQLEN